MKKKIMIVDDSASVRQLVSSTLLDGGYEVVEAVDGQDALDKFQITPTDLVISDLNMPIMDGIELVKQLRALPGQRFLPIIMLTTESQDAKKQEGRAAGASGWLVKPFKAEQILSVVKMVLVN
ncbi:MAG: two-component system response regulator [Desulfuromonas sp.]|nr:MAG: two-component system response regulator [Desulfuromonas sp.]